MANTTGIAAASSAGRRRARCRAPARRSARPCLLHQRLQHLSWRTGLSAVLAMNCTMPADWNTRSIADGQFGKEAVGQIVDDHADDLRLRLAQIGRAAIVDVADVLDRLASPCRRFRADERRCPGGRAKPSTSTPRPAARYPVSSPCSRMPNLFLPDRFFAHYWNVLILQSCDCQAPAATLSARDKRCIRQNVRDFMHLYQCCNAAYQGMPGPPVVRTLTIWNVPFIRRQKSPSYAPSRELPLPGLEKHHGFNQPARAPTARSSATRPARLSLPAEKHSHRCREPSMPPPMSSPTRCACPTPGRRRPSTGTRR